MFVDRVQVELQAGRGGDGCSSFRREKYVPRGGPNGGNGGNGGSIIIEARAGVNSLAEYAGRKFWRAPAGTHGGGGDKHGRRGRDMKLWVPPGTTIYDAQHGFVIKDLVNPGDSVEICHGGRGGFGNAHFKTSTNRAPREALPGEEGERRVVVFELRSIADVGLIGMPNAGKSTLLSRLTRARPEIADYPFTTKFPNLGRVFVSRDRSFVLADIPGLIEGAHTGVGLGHEFLRHIQRAGLLVHLVEPQPIDGSQPIHNYEVIRAELTEYSEELAKRDEIVAVTKAELPGSEELCAELAQQLGRKVFLISAVTGQGLRELVEEIYSHLEAKGTQTHSPPLHPVELEPIRSPDAIPDDEEFAADDAEVEEIEADAADEIALEDSGDIPFDDAPIEIEDAPKPRRKRPNRNSANRRNTRTYGDSTASDEAFSEEPAAESSTDGPAKSRPRRDEAAPAESASTEETQTKPGRRVPPHKAGPTSHMTPPSPTRYRPHEANES